MNKKRTKKSNQYIQYSTGVKDGKAGFIEFFLGFVANNLARDIQIIRKIEDGKNVFLQVYQDINNGEAKWVTTHFFDTDQDDRIIEYWGNLEPVPEVNVNSDKF